MVSQYVVPRRGRTPDTERDAQIAALVNEDKTVPEIAEAIGATTNTVRGACTRLGLTARPARRGRQSTVAETHIVEAVADGLCAAQTAARLGVSVEVIRGRARAFGVALAMDPRSPRRPADPERVAAAAARYAAGASSIEISRELGVSAQTVLQYVRAAGGTVREAKRVPRDEAFVSAVVDARRRGLTLRQVADELDVSVSTVTRTLSRARGSRS